MAYKLLRFQTVENVHFATDFKENSMASRMNSGSSNDLNCIEIDSRTVEKFSFNVDIVAAMAWQHPQQCAFIHACEYFHVSSNGGVFVIVLFIMSLSTNEIGRYLNYIQKQKLATWYAHIGRSRGTTTTFWVPVHMDFLVTYVIHSRSIAWLRGFAKSLWPFRASLAIILILICATFLCCRCWVRPQILWQPSVSLRANWPARSDQKQWVPCALYDQTQVDSKPATQPEQASLNQCQLIAANSPKLVLCASPADGGDKVSL